MLPVGTGMLGRTTKVLYAYWNDVRGDRIAPRRLEIEPTRIADVLHETFILERSDAHTYSYRLAGTRICDMFGFELRGSNFLEGWREDHRAEMEHALHDACSRGAVVRLELEAGGEHPRQRARFEALLLPLVHLRPQADRLLGSLTCLEAPVWLGAVRIAARQLLRIEIIWPDGRPRALVDGLNRQAPFLPEIRHAKLVRSNRRQFRVYNGGRTNDER